MSHQAGANIVSVRIVVLTYNRPVSLHRLLRSLETADYTFPLAPPWRRVLEVRVDGGVGPDWERTVSLARGFRFTAGEVEVVVEEEHHGVEDAWPWRHAWTWREGELFVILEDDVEVSRFWYRGLVNMWIKYGSYPQMSGAALQQQTFSVTGDSRTDLNISSLVSSPVYFYQLPSSVGLSPHPCHWTRMMAQHGHHLGSCPASMQCWGQVWESWWLQYNTDNLLFTLYTASQGGLAVDHREAGYHHQETQLTSFETKIKSQLNC